MSDHFRKVVDARKGDWMPMAEALAFYENEVLDGGKDLIPSGRIWDMAKRLPGLMQFRYNQLQELEAILEHITLQANKVFSEHKRRYMEAYQKQLTERAAGEFANTEADLYELRIWVNEVAMVRNKFLGLTKGLEYMHFQMSNLTKLRAAGVEDVIF